MQTGTKHFQLFWALVTLVLLNACVQKTTHTYVTSIQQDVQAFSNGRYVVINPPPSTQEAQNSKTLPKEVASGQNIKSVAQQATFSALTQKLQLKAYKDEKDAPLNEDAIFLLPSAIKIVLIHDIFKNDDATPSQKSRILLESLSQFISQHPQMIVQVTGHSDPSESSKRYQELSDNRALSIAEILALLGMENEAYAKGCGIQKPIFDTNTAENNARVEIFLYHDKKDMIDRCNK